MTFIQAFENIKSRLDKNNAAAKINSDFAIQVELTNKDCSGIFYLQNKDGKLVAEPYDYYDNDVAVSVSYLNFSKLIDGRLVASKAIEKGNISAIGNFDILDAVCGIVPEVKAAKKKPVAKAEQKPTKAPVKEAAKPAKAEVKTTKPPVKEVVKPEVKSAPAKDAAKPAKAVSKAVKPSKTTKK